jgi:hypothetical protein
MAVTAGPSVRNLEARGNRFTGSAGPGGMYVEDIFLNLSGTSYNRGDVVQLNATPEVHALAAGAYVNAGTDDSIDTSDCATLILMLYGIAMKDSPASGQAAAPVAVFVPGSIVEGTLVEGIDGGALADHTSVAADRAGQVGIVQDDDGTFYFSSTSGEKIGTVIGVPGILGDAQSGGNIGDDNIRVHVLINEDIMRHAFPSQDT